MIVASISPILARCAHSGAVVFPNAPCTPTNRKTNPAPRMIATTLVRKSTAEKPASKNSPDPAAIPTTASGGTSAAAMATPERIAARFGRAMA